MDIALCTIDGQVYNSVEFPTLEPSQIEQLRQALVCKECDGPAYYRKASKDGKKACFGADHGNNCSLQIEGGSYSNKKAVSVLLNKILVANKLVSIDFSIARKAATGSLSTLATGAGPSKGSGVGKCHDLEPGASKISKLKISSILRLLLNSPRFSQSDVLVSTGSAHPFKAKNLFINCKNVDLEWIKKMHLQKRNTWRGYWGTVRTCTAAWITVAGALIKTDNLNPVAFSKFANKTGSIDYDEVIGCPILIFGALKKSANDKLIVVTDDTTAVVILRYLMLDN